MHNHLEVVKICYNPVTIYDKRGKLFDKEVSCRKCIECRQTRANEWALRMSQELKDHKESCYITLTYRKNPIVLYKPELQKFIKRLRKFIGKDTKIKYFACGEYGDQMLRPHYHLMIFGYEFKDLLYGGKTGSGIDYWLSNDLDKVWGYGRCTHQMVHPQAMKYVALYNAKTKKDGTLPEELWEFPEFNTMSQGIGKNQMMKNIDVFLKTDEIYLDGFANKIPNYILNKLEMDEKYENKVITTRAKRYVERDERQLILKKRKAEKKKRFTKLRNI